MLCINNLVTDSPRTTPLPVITTYNYKPRDGNETVFFDFDIASRFYVVDCAFVLAIVSRSPFPFILAPRSVYIPSSEHANKSKLTTVLLDKEALAGWGVNIAP